MHHLKLFILHAPHLKNHHRAEENQTCHSHAHMSRVLASIMPRITVFFLVVDDPSPMQTTLLDIDSGWHDPCFRVRD
jgi:hypothetical protein